MKKLKKTNVSIISLTHEEARKFFLRNESYCNFDLPNYFNFEKLIERISSYFEKNGKDDICKKLLDNKKDKPSNYDDINYKIIHNKDGRYAWRPLQLIHPVIYVLLVHELTSEDNWKFLCDRFREFSSNLNIECISVPKLSSTKNSNKAERVSSWWHDVEQKSIEMALEYRYLTYTDITDCYGSIYTHSVPWALHTKEAAKVKRDDNNLLGNIIDKHLRNMSHGQTNGIPQGSVLMDFIAEMVLGYADLLLSEKLQGVKNYKIIRYRDDYRIFTTDQRNSEKIIRFLSEVMIDLGLKLNPEKTKFTNDIVESALKNDKLFWIKQKQFDKNIQKNLLIVHGLSKHFPNSGSLISALNQLYDRISKFKKNSKNTLSLISILVDIAYKNPRVYPIVSAIISLFIKNIKSDDDKKNIIKKIVFKFSDISNTGHLMLWLQRICLGIKYEHEFEEPICRLVSGDDIQIWNSDWLQDDFKSIIDAKEIVDFEYINKLDEIIVKKEVSLFLSENHY